MGTFIGTQAPPPGTYTGPLNTRASNPWISRLPTGLPGRQQQSMPPPSAPVTPGGIGTRDPRFLAGNRQLGAYGMGPKLDGMGHPVQGPTIGGTIKGLGGIGGKTWAPGAIPVTGSNGQQQMTYGGPSSWGATQDDGYRIGPGNKTGDGKFHDTFGTGLGQIAAGSPMASMGRDLASGRRPPDIYGQAANDTSAYDKNFKRLSHGGKVGGTGTGDKVRALLDPREFVMKPEAVKRIGVKKLERMNDGEEPIKMREGGHVAKAKWRRQGIGTDYGSFGPEFSGALDERYIRNTIDPLTNMSRMPSQFDIDRKRRELLHSGDIEALAQFDHLNHATRSGDPGAIADARQRFLEFRAARNYYSGLQQPRMPSIAERAPVVEESAPTQQSPWVPSYQSGTVTQTPLGRVLHGSVYGTGSSTLMPPAYTPPTQAPAAPQGIRAPADYSGITQGTSIEDVAPRIGASLGRGDYRPQVTAAPELLQAPMDLRAAVRETSPQASSLEDVVASMRGTLTGPPRSAKPQPPPYKEPPLPSQIVQNVSHHFGDSPLGLELKKAFIDEPMAAARALKKIALGNPNFAQSKLGEYLQKK